MKKFLTLGFVTLLSVGCTQTAPAPKEEAGTTDQKLTVSTSFYPLTHFAKQVGGNAVEVQQVAAQGTDPHSYEPTPQQIEQVFESDVFIFNGLGQDPYADRLYEELEQKGTSVLIATELVDRLAYEEEHEEDEHHDAHNDHEDEHEHHDEERHDEHEDEHGDNHDDSSSAKATEDKHDDHNHGEWDPHVWLDPLRVMHIVEEIAEEFSELDPSNADQFNASAATYIADLKALDTEMKQGLSSCAQDSIIVSHDAYRYLASRYGFHTLEIAGLSPSEKPSPARLAKLTDIAKDKGITYVFFETQVNPALSETLAAEIGAETMVLHSIEARTKDERSTGKTYIDLQRMNLENLRIALQCS